MKNSWQATQESLNSLQNKNSWYPKKMRWYYSLVRASSTHYAKKTSKMLEKLGPKLQNVKNDLIDFLKKLVDISKFGFGLLEAVVDI